MKKVLVIAIALTFVMAAWAMAGDNPTNKIAIHFKTHPTSCLKGYPVITTCEGIVETWAPLGDLDAMPVFYDLVSYGVVETGLTWPAEWLSTSWVRCKGDIAVGNIVNPGDGTAIAWTACQTTWGVIPGAAWLAATGAGYVCPVPNPATNMFGVVDCRPAPGPYYDGPQCVSCGGVGGFIGDDPCRPTAVEPSTWGEIKSIFK